MDTTVAQLAIVEIGLLSPFTSQLSHTGHRLAVTLALFNLVLQHLSHITMDVQVIVDFLFDEITHIFIDADTLWRHHR